MRTIFAKSILCSMTGVALTACGGGGVGSIATNTAAKPTISAKAKLDNIAGTMGNMMDVEQTTFVANKALSTKTNRQPGGTNLATASGPSFSAKKNFLGGLDVEIDGKEVSLQTENLVGETAWYKSTGHNETRFSLSLWNAGKDSGAGLLANAAGQNYHKIIGYDYTDANKVQSRGHVVYGQTTSAQDYAKLERSATFDGYYSAFITPAQMPTGHIDNDSAIISGGMEIVADFDRNTVSGKSKNVQLREAGSYDFNMQSFDIAMDSAAIQSDGQGGLLYSGKLSSTDSRIDGANYTGTFYGSQAQETAGTLSGDTTDPANGKKLIVDGFYSAAR